MKLYIPLLVFVGASYLVHGQAPVKPKAVAHQHRPAMFKYDLEADIGETNNLADKYPERVAELKELFEKVTAGKNETNHGNTT